jgi:hypothetical protein
MNSSWGTKAIHRRKRALLRTKVRWDVLGLQDPAHTTSSLTIEDLRRQIISASSEGLSLDTVSRSHPKDARPKPRSKSSTSSRKLGASSK